MTAKYNACIVACIKMYDPFMLNMVWKIHKVRKFESGKEWNNFETENVEPWTILIH